MLDSIHLDIPAPNEEETLVESIKKSITNMERYFGKTPDIIVMNRTCFEEWFTYCEDKGTNPSTFAGIEIVLEQDSPAPYAFIIDKNEAVRKKLGT